MNNNSPPLTFKRFQTIVSRLELPRRPLPTVSQQQMNKCGTKMADNHDQLYSIPSLEELGTPASVGKRPRGPSAPLTFARVSRVPDGRVASGGLARRRVRSLGEAAQTSG